MIGYGGVFAFWCRSQPPHGHVASSPSPWAEEALPVVDGGRVQGSPVSKPSAPPKGKDSAGRLMARDFRRVCRATDGRACRTVAYYLEVLYHNRHDWEPGYDVPCVLYSYPS